MVDKEIKQEYKIVRDPIYGYRRLDPIPDEGRLSEFYRRRYYDANRDDGDPPEVLRLMSGGQEAEREVAWLRATVHADICLIIRERAPGTRVLDVGSGSGALLKSLGEEGFTAVGIEPSSEAAGYARLCGLMVREGTLEACAGSLIGEGAGFDAVILCNVLEHIPDPIAMIQTVKTLLNPGGLLCVRVPNDFSEFQAAAQKALGKEAWWVAIPDHINYFDIASARALMLGQGFEVIQVMGDFPMELFLLMGDDYVGKPDIGRACHAKRVRFEMSIPGDVRRRLYRAAAEAGVGRDFLIVGKLDAAVTDE